MSDVIRVLKKKIQTIHSLQSLVKTIKILSAMNIASYERSVEAISHYAETVELGIIACLRSSPRIQEAIRREEVVVHTIGAIIFGSDQGMVGSFNDQVSECLVASLGGSSAEKIIWPVGERLKGNFDHQSGMTVKNIVSLPISLKGMSNLISTVLEHLDEEKKPLDRLVIFYNEPGLEATYKPTSCTLLPLDINWLDSLLEKKWPTRELPEVIGNVEETLAALIREHLFLSIFRACVASLASENASRLALMQVAEKRIDTRLQAVTLQYHKSRQALIDEELFSMMFI